MRNQRSRHRLLLLRWMVTLGVVGLYFLSALGALPAGWLLPVIGPVLLLPLLWPRQFASWVGLLLLSGGLGVCVWLINRADLSDLGLLGLGVAVLFFLLASPLALTLFCWRQRTAPCVMLAGVAFFPFVFLLLLNHYGNPMTLVAHENALVLQVTWLASIWYPLSAIFSGGAVFVIQLAVLLIQEAQDRGGAVVVQQATH